MITLAQPEHSSGELKRRDYNLLQFCMLLLGLTLCVGSELHPEAGNE